MFAFYLFTIVFVSLCLLTADTQPRNFSFETLASYEVHSDLDTLAWVTDFAADVPSQPRVLSNVPSETKETDARVKAITEAMTKAEILSNIKRNGWWEPCLSRMTKVELARVMAAREKLK